MFSLSSNVFNSAEVKWSCLISVDKERILQSICRLLPVQNTTYMKETLKWASDTFNSISVQTKTNPTPTQKSRCKLNCELCEPINPKSELKTRATSAKEKKTLQQSFPCSVPNLHSKHRTKGLVSESLFYFKEWVKPHPSRLEEYNWYRRKLGARNIRTDGSVILEFSKLNK